VWKKATLVLGTLVAFGSGGWWTIGLLTT